MPVGHRHVAVSGELGGIDESRLKQLLARQDLGVSDEARELVEIFGDIAPPRGFARHGVDLDEVRHRLARRAFGNRLLHDVHVGEFGAVCSACVRSSDVGDQDERADDGEDERDDRADDSGLHSGFLGGCNAIAREW